MQPSELRRSYRAWLLTATHDIGIPRVLRLKADAFPSGASIPRHKLAGPVALLWGWPRARSPLRPGEDATRGSRTLPAAPCRRMRHHDSRTPATAMDPAPAPKRRHPESPVTAAPPPWHQVGRGHYEYPPTTSWPRGWLTCASAGRRAAVGIFRLAAHGCMTLPRLRIHVSQQGDARHPIHIGKVGRRSRRNSPAVSIPAGVTACLSARGVIRGWNPDRRGGIIATHPTLCRFGRRDRTDSLSPVVAARGTNTRNAPGPIRERRYPGPRTSYFRSFIGTTSPLLATFPRMLRAGGVNLYVKGWDGRRQRDTKGPQIPVSCAVLQTWRPSASSDQDPAPWHMA